VRGVLFGFFGALILGPSVRLPTAFPPLHRCFPRGISCASLGHLAAAERFPVWFSRALADNRSAKDRRVIKALSVKPIEPRIEQC
jgi:hypothetical protein